MDVEMSGLRRDLCRCFSCLMSYNRQKGERYAVFLMVCLICSLMSYNRQKGETETESQRGINMNRNPHNAGVFGDGEA